METYIPDQDEKFEKLLKTNVNEYTEQRNGLTYLSWTYAWQEFVKVYPEATYELLPWTYDENLGYMVYTRVNTAGKSLTMWLPVMDGANKAMKSHPYSYSTRYGEKQVEQATMFDVNKAYMRCLVKNIAMFGLGLYIYAGDDLPPSTAEEGENAPKQEKKTHEAGNLSKAEIVKKIEAECKRIGRETVNAYEYFKLTPDSKVEELLKMLNALSKMTGGV